MAPATKRRKLNGPVARIEDLTFDPSARQEYLTGFHKRKQARIQTAREAAVKREKEERVRERRLLREQRKDELEQHVRAVNAEVKKQNAVLDGIEHKEGIDGDEPDAQSAEDGEPESSGSDEPELQEEQLHDEEEYVDEDKYTTVTVEPMGDLGNDTEKDENRTLPSIPEKLENGNSGPIKKKRPWVKDTPGHQKPKRKKFRYESKAERALSRQKQKTKNRAAKARREGK